MKFIIYSHQNIFPITASRVKNIYKWKTVTSIPHKLILILQLWFFLFLHSLTECAKNIGIFKVVKINIFSYKTKDLHAEC